MSSSIDPMSALNFLKSVIDPETKKDLVTQGTIQELKVSPTGQVSLRLILSTPAHPMKEKYQEEIKRILKSKGASDVFIVVSAEVKPTNRGTSHQGTKRVDGVSAIQGVTNIIAVSSGKGGVGKSTVSVNLALALALEGAKVGLMDTDVYGPNIPTMMGVTERPQIFNHPTRGELFAPPSAHGIKIMSMGFLTDPDQPLVWRGPMLHSVISQFCHQVDWGQLDYLIVDMPPGTGDVQLSLAQMVPVSGVVLVTTPQEVSMQDVRKAYAMFDKVKIPILGFVENMSWFQPEDSDKKYYIFGEGGGKQLALKYHSELLAQFPLVIKIREGGDEGRPIVVREPSSPTAEGFKNLARKVALKVAKMAEEGVDPNQLIQIGKFN